MQLDKSNNYHLLHNYRSAHYSKLIGRYHVYTVVAYVIQSGEMMILLDV